jgi:hypothetical protein
MKGIVPPSSDVTSKLPTAAPVAPVHPASTLTTKSNRFPPVILARPMVASYKANPRPRSDWLNAGRQPIIMFAYLYLTAKEATT